MVNNDNLLVVLVTGLLYALTRVAVRGVSRRHDIAIGLLLGLALLTKGTALLVAVTVPPALWLAVASSNGSAKGNVRSTIESTVRVATVAFVAGGWWPIRNLILYGTLQPAGGARPPASPGFRPDFTTWLADYLQHLVRTAFGDAGRLVLARALLLVVVLLLELGERPASVALQSAGSGPPR